MKEGEKTTTIREFTVMAKALNNSKFWKLDEKKWKGTWEGGTGVCETGEVGLIPPREGLRVL